jgi:CheY-like chemotaxis protein
MTKPLGVLLADDDGDDIELLLEAFRTLSHDLTFYTVSDGKKAIDWLAAYKPDKLPCCIILDYNMPHMNALQVLEWICERPIYDGIPKFVWSTSARVDFVDACREKGIVEYFIKPVGQDGFHSIAAAILQHCRKSA